MSAKRFRVAVCGGGIGGLTCAVALSQYPDIEVDIYEAETSFTKSGPGCGAWLRTWDILEKLGLDKDLARIAGTQPTDDPVSTFNFRKSDGAVGIEFLQLTTRGGLLGIHRSDFAKVALRHLPPTCKVYCSKRLLSYRQLPNHPVEIRFADGTTATCDVLVGADGINSSVRRVLLREQAHHARAEGRQRDSDNILGSVDPVWTGTLAYTATISAERLREKAPHHRAFSQSTQYLGKNGYILAYPVAQGKIINVTGFHTRAGMENMPFRGPLIQRTGGDELLHAYNHWEPEVQALLECVDRASQWAIHRSKLLNSYIAGRVALLGDAAHAMEPYQGMGAGQAIEDAYLLATLLGQWRTTISTIPDALRAYDAIRQPFANDVARRNRLTGSQFMFLGDNFDWDNCQDDTLKSRLHHLSSAITNNWEWAWSTTIDGSVEEAIRML